MRLWQIIILGSALGLIGGGALYRYALAFDDRDTSNLTTCMDGSALELSSACTGNDYVKGVTNGVGIYSNDTLRLSVDDNETCSRGNPIELSSDCAGNDFVQTGTNAVDVYTNNTKRLSVGDSNVDITTAQSLTGDLTLTAGGTVTTTANGDIVLDANGSGNIDVRDCIEAGDGTYSWTACCTAAGDICTEQKLEVGGTSTLKGAVTIPNTSSVTANTWVKATRFEGYTGNPGTGGIFEHSVTTTNTGSQSIIRIAPTMNQASGSAENNYLIFDITETAVGSGEQSFIKAKAGGAVKFRVANTGAVTSATGYAVGAATGLTNNTSYWLCTAADCSTKCQVTITGGLITGCP